MATSQFHCVYHILYIPGTGIFTEISPKYKLSDSAVGSHVLSTVTGVQNLSEIK